MIASLGALAAVPANPATAQNDPGPSAAQRCFEHHKFGAQPVDVAKTTDRQTVLAQVSWGYHDAIGCYLTLDAAALAALRAAPAPQSLPTAETEASRQCFEHHKFGRRPVDVAKSADRQTVLARLSWGHHPSIGCYLTLDDTALTTLRTAADTAPGDDPTDETTVAIAGSAGHVCALKTDQTIICRHHTLDDETPVFPGRTFTELIAVDGPNGCALGGDQALACWGWYADPESRQWQLQELDTPDDQLTQISASAGGFSTLWRVCGLRADETLACWDWGVDFESGKWQPSDTYTPSGRYTEGFIISTTGAVWGDGGCGLRADQTIACWLTSGVDLDTPAGRYIEILYVHPAPGSGVCARRADQTIACWHWVHDWENNQWTLQTDAPAGQYTEIDGNCGRRADQTIACWRWVYDLESDQWTLQTDIPAGQYTEIDGNCGLRADQTIACWRWDEENGKPRLQLDTLAGRFTAGRFTGSSAFSNAGCGLRADQTIACWRWDRDSEGNRWQLRTDTPTGQYTEIDGNCGLRADQTTVCWNWSYDWENSQWQLQADALSGQFAEVSANSGIVCGLRTDGAITCASDFWSTDRGWKFGTSGPPSGTFAAVLFSHQAICGLRSDDALICSYIRFAAGDGWGDDPIYLK